MSLDKDILRKCKSLAAERLSAIELSRYKLDEIDSRLSEYAYELRCNPKGHNLFELLGLLRFFRFLDSYEFHTGVVRSFIALYEFLKFAGKGGRQRYKLTPVQVFQFANILGFYADATRRRVRDALIFVPRKFSKTTEVATLAIWDMLFGDSNAEAYTAANSYEQAQICFKEIKAIMRNLDKGLKNFKLNREKISFIERKRSMPRSSFIRCVASNADKLDGLNASTVIMDEYSQADNSDLYNVLTTSMGVRTNPLTVVITTASDKNNGPFATMLDSYKVLLLTELLKGGNAPMALALFGADFVPVDNDRVFAHIFEPDVDDEESDPRTWAKVQPHLGITVQPDYYEIQYQKALMSADDMKAFRTKLLNIFVSGNDHPWLTGAEMRRHAERVDLAGIGQRRPCMVAVDLSVKDDFSAVTYGVYYNEGFNGAADKRGFHFHTDYYFPAGCLPEHPNRGLYENWAAQGYLNLCPGDVISYDQIVEDILSRNAVLKILQIGYDPYKSSDFVNLMAASSAKGIVAPVKQTYGAFTAPVESWEYGVRTNAITINANPINYFCYDNAVLDEDRLENKKPIKKSQNLKIDGVITGLMALKEFNEYIR